MHILHPFVYLFCQDGALDFHDLIFRAFYGLKVQIGHICSRSLVSSVTIFDNVHGM